MELLRCQEVVSVNFLPLFFLLCYDLKEQGGNAEVLNIPLDDYKEFKEHIDAYL